MATEGWTWRERWRGALLLLAVLLAWLAIGAALAIVLWPPVAA